MAFEDNPAAKRRNTRTTEAGHEQRRHHGQSRKCESRIVRLGVGSPLWWLCTTSSAVVPGVSHGGTNTSGSEMDVLERGDQHFGDDSRLSHSPSRGSGTRR
jgi:hypothetical protein